MLKPIFTGLAALALTGDYERDLAASRSKRIFDDRTGARCDSHTQQLSLQTYKRDSGEVMHDLSVPLYVNRKHRGGFRIGYCSQAGHCRMTAKFGKS